MKLSSYPLVVLLLADLLHLIKKLSHSKLQLCEFVFSLHLLVVHCMLSNINVQVNSLQQ